MTKYFISLVSGLIFSFGLTISGMTRPHKVVGFLNVFRDWDVTLFFVMAGAILVHGASFFLIKKRQSPLLDNHFHISKNSSVDRRLLIGSALFGVGWALAGLCPGPAIVSLASGRNDIIAFLIAMTIGSIISRKVFG